jgi:hypothetical protein
MSANWVPEAASTDACLRLTEILPEGEGFESSPLLQDSARAVNRATANILNVNFITARFSAFCKYTNFPFKIRKNQVFMNVRNGAYFCRIA